jgi:hypothetical protein
VANPFALLEGRGPSADLRIQFFAGRTHGDLHEDNVLVPSTNTTAEPESFRLVDLSTFEEIGSMSRDLAMLSVSSLTRRLGDLSPEQRESLLDCLADHTRLPDRAASGSPSLPSHLSAFVDEIIRVVYTTNAIESLNARFRQATRRRGHFPNEQAALKVLYLVIRSPRRNRANVTGTTGGWKSALNSLAMYYGERITGTEGDHRLTHKDPDSPTPESSLH